MGTKKQVYENLDGQRVVVSAVNVLTTDDIDQMRKNIVEMVESYNFNNGVILTLDEDENTFFIKETGQFTMKPKLKKRRNGVINFRSQDYVFLADGEETESYGSKKSIKPHDDGLGFDLPWNDKGGHLEYRLESVANI